MLYDVDNLVFHRVTLQTLCGCSQQLTQVYTESPMVLLGRIIVAPLAQRRVSIKQSYDTLFDKEPRNVCRRFVYDTHFSEDESNVRWVYVEEHEK